MTGSTRAWDWVWRRQRPPARQQSPRFAVRRAGRGSARPANGLHHRMTARAAEQAPAPARENPPSCKAPCPPAGPWPTPPTNCDHRSLMRTTSSLPILNILVNGRVENTRGIRIRPPHVGDATPSLTRRNLPSARPEGQVPKVTKPEGAIAAATAARSRASSVGPRSVGRTAPWQGVGYVPRTHGMPPALVQQAPPRSRRLRCGGSSVRPSHLVIQRRLRTVASA